MCFLEHIRKARDAAYAPDQVKRIDHANREALAMSLDQGATAREWAAKLRTFQDTLHTAAYGDPSREWTHLPLVQVSLQNGVTT